MAMMFHTERSVAERKYNRQSRSEFLEDVRKFLKESGLDATQTFLVTNLLQDGQRRILLEEIIGIMVHLRQVLVTIE